MGLWGWPSPEGEGPFPPINGAAPSPKWEAGPGAEAGGTEELKLVFCVRLLGCISENFGHKLNLLRIT